MLSYANWYIKHLLIMWQLDKTSWVTISITQHLLFSKPMWPSVFLYKNITHGHFQFQYLKTLGLTSTETMKPQNICGESSLCEESKRGFRQKLGQAYEAALLVMARNGAQKGRGLLISKSIERRRWNYSAEDPIRTLMFLGSWSHT